MNLTSHYKSFRSSFTTSPTTLTTTLINIMSNPRVFFDITIDSQPKGRIAFELFHDVVPKTADNFLHLCLGDKGTTKSGVPLSYKGSGEWLRYRRAG